MAADNSSEGILVGAEVRPDGTLDLSHALRATPGELKISDPIIDRLRGPLVIDREREQRYQNFRRRTEQMQREGTLETWFADLLNSLRNPGNPEIVPDDLHSLELVSQSPELQALSSQYGYQFARPYFRFNLADFQKVYRKLTGHLGSNGVTIGGGSLETNEATRGVALILTPGLDADDLHELGHSIDPNQHKRAPQDAILEEFATYYRDTYIPKIYTTKSVQRDASGAITAESKSTREVYERMDRIRATLKSDLCAGYRRAFDSPEAYERAVDEIAGVILALEKHLSKPEVNKCIYNARSSYELNHLLEVTEREKRGI
jgi:hypothetical protein